MIEFKAECGHTVRAKDADAGGVVRCSYCGRKVNVPDNMDDDLDFLFQDIQQPGEPSVARRRKRSRVRRIFAKRPRSSGQFDPFAIIFRMCYAALLVTIVVFVGKKYFLPLFQEGGLYTRVASRAREPPAGETPTAVTEPQRVRRKGLITNGDLSGLYVNSTPPGAMVYCVEASKAPTAGRIHGIEGCVQTRAGGEWFRLSDDTYVVEVVLPWNDPSLNDPDLPYYQKYREFRRAIEHASDEERMRLLEDYFVADEARPVFIDQTEEQIYIVRQYRNVQVRNGRSKGVRALFLPKILLPGRKSFSIEQLVTDYIPKKTAYNIAETYVLNELDYYGVPKPDRLFVIEALERLGVIPYVTPDGRTRLFKIALDDGMFASKVIREAKE